MNEMIRWMRRSVFWKTIQIIKHGFHYTRNNVEAYCTLMTGAEAEMMLKKTLHFNSTFMIIAEVKFREQKTQTEFPPLLVSLVVLLHPDLQSQCSPYVDIRGRWGLIYSVLISLSNQSRQDFACVFFAIVAAENGFPLKKLGYFSRCRLWWNFGEQVTVIYDTFPTEKVYF